MTEQPMKLVIDVPTGEQKYIPLSKDEIAEREQWLAEEAAAESARQAEELAKLQAKEAIEAKLASLGITAEEISALKA